MVPKSKSLVLPAPVYGFLYRGVEDLGRVRSSIVHVSSQNQIGLNPEDPGKADVV
jgi:hypothetical protein